MTTFQSLLWGAAILMVAILNVLDILPDWTTFAAILTLPFVAASRVSRCTPGQSS